MYLVGNWRNSNTGIFCFYSFSLFFLPIRRRPCYRYRTMMLSEMMDNNKKKKKSKTTSSWTIMSCRGKERKKWRQERKKSRENVAPTSLSLSFSPTFISSSFLPYKSWSTINGFFWVKPVTWIWKEMWRHLFLHARERGEKSSGTGGDSSSYSNRPPQRERDWEKKETRRNALPPDGTFQD